MTDTQTTEHTIPHSLFVDLMKLYRDRQKLAGRDTGLVCAKKAVEELLAKNSVRIES